MDEILYVKHLIDTLLTLGVKHNMIAAKAGVSRLLILNLEKQTAIPTYDKLQTIKVNLENLFTSVGIDPTLLGAEEK